MRDRHAPTIDAIVAAEGFAIGRGVRFSRESSMASRLTLREAIARVRRDLRHLRVALAHKEAELFEPEARILDELEPRLRAREATNQPAEEAVLAETSCGCSDLVMDLRMRLLGAIAGSWEADLRLPPEHEGAEMILLAALVTPSMVASLPPRVVGVVATLDGSMTARRDVGRASHAAVLARGRGLAFVYAPSRVVDAIPDAASIVLDAAESGATLWTNPDEVFLVTARERFEAVRRTRPSRRSS